MKRKKQIDDLATFVDGYANSPLTIPLALLYFPNAASYQESSRGRLDFSSKVVDSIKTNNTNKKERPNHAAVFSRGLPGYRKKYPT